MSKTDILYNGMIEDVIINGVWDKGMEVRPHWKDGTPAYSKSIIGRSLRFDNSEVPILTSKEVKWKAAIVEAPIWIWQMKSNIVQELRDLGSNIWNEWEITDKNSMWQGTIGPAYGYQLGKIVYPYDGRKLDISLLNPKKKYQTSRGLKYPHEMKTWTVLLDQVDYLLQELKNNPASRRHMTMLWNWDEILDMSLTPCVYETQWHVKEGKLHLEVRARSSDLGLGHPFNVFQYNVLQRMFAQVLGYELGEYIFHMGDAHIYDRHIETLTEQLSAPMHEAPTLWMNPAIKNFYDFTLNDFKLENYTCEKFRRMEVAV